VHGVDVGRGVRGSLGWGMALPAWSPPGHSLPSRPCSKRINPIDFMGMDGTARIVESPGSQDVGSVVGEIAAAIARTITMTSGSWPERPAEHATDRTGIRVLSGHEYDVWLLRWPTGTSVTPHDHGSSIGGFCVVKGSLIESRWEHGALTSRMIGTGEAVTIDRGVVHDVVSISDGSLSVHVYSPPLTLMNFYDEEGRVVVRSETIDVTPRP
jgi:Cysteine dioxygenase type I